MRLIILSFALLLTSLHTDAQVRPVALLSEVLVEHGNIFLSDLLPPKTAPELRSIAASISLGRSPQPGSFRVFTREQVRARVGDVFPVSLPDQVVVRRTLSEDSGGKIALLLPRPHPMPHFLVKPADPAALVIEEDSLRIQLRVLPLRRASLGESVRVVDPITRRIFSAQVSGKNVLRLQGPEKNTQ